MQRLSLSERPARRPLAGNTFWLCCASLGIMVLGAYAVTSHATIITIFTLVYATGMMLIWGTSAVELYLDLGHNRALARLIESHLASHLAQEDWEQLRQAALEYPQIRPWLRERIKQGDLTYQDAEPLTARINHYIAEHQAPSRQSPVSLNSQQKLLQLLQVGTATGGAPSEGPPFVTVKLKTTGGSLIYARHSSP